VGTSTVDAMVEATPADRDRVVDFLRAASICAVVVGHWSIAIVWWDHGVLRVTSAIGVTSWLWLATWVLQVMPIFFYIDQKVLLSPGACSRLRADFVRPGGQGSWG